jgi:hypothetical protein
MVAAASSRFRDVFIVTSVQRALAHIGTCPRS